MAEDIQDVQDVEVADVQDVEVEDVEVQDVTDPATAQEPVEEDETAMTPAEQLAGGFGFAPKIETAETLSLDARGEMEAAQMEGMPVDEVSPGIVADVIDDDIDIMTSAPKEITDQDIKDIDEGKYDPVIEANE
jgi:hypothetical protein